MGQLAKQTGLTVRMLHHYDKIGLLSPSMYSDGGHRLYTEADIIKLQQVISLKHLGFALEEIRRLIESPVFDPAEVIKTQMESVKEHIRLQERLCNRLERIYELVKTRQPVNAEQLIHLIEDMNMSLDRYFTKEQLEKIKTYIGEPETRKQYLNEFIEIIARIRLEMEKNTPPENVDITRFIELRNILTCGGDIEIRQTVSRFYHENPEVLMKFGIKIDKQLTEYVKKIKLLQRIDGK
ncbi:MAG: MerR family transcriptional regulator [Negativicutes bacterium]|nr:MerR family transcriptional regulator [Negativicutes bacterium]